MLQAPPGAGKTTRVPLALLDEAWLADAKIILLEPRRLAARAAARWMASSLGERVGERVGYRVHLDTRVGPRTRIEVVTEGILTRLLQSDPALDGIGLVIFDELHERTLHADLGLALALQTQRLLRPALRLLAMSATLDATPVAELLGGVAAIRSEGRAFPVETRYLSGAAAAATRRDPGGRHIEGLVVSTIVTALRENAGDLLVFLPGAAEIRGVAARLAELPLGRDVDVAPLYGNLSPDAQDRAILPSPAGRRKVVLATSIAETSLTIEGVRVVIDSGLARAPRFSPRSGMTRLETVRVSRAAADQRRGRAGRLAPGVCYRLWPENEDAHLVPRMTPEILEADLAPLALELAAAGIVDPLELSWLDPPPRAALAQARELLAELDAIDDRHRITQQGKQMTGLGLHPRLAHMLVRARALGGGAAPLACSLAALLSERDVLRSEGNESDVDLRVRLPLLRGGGAGPGVEVDHGALRRVRAEAEHLAKLLGAGSRAVAPNDEREAGALVALAYPDRVAQRRATGRGRFLLRNGRGAAIDARHPLAGAEYLAIAAVDDRLPDGRVFLAAPLTRDEIEEQFASQITEEDIVAWDDVGERVAAVRRRRLGAIVLTESALRDPDPLRVAEVLTGALARAGIAALPWSEAASRLRQRLAFLHRVDGTWPDVGDDHLTGAMRDWLAPRVMGMRSRQEVARLDLAAALLDLLSWEQRAALDDLAPTHVVVPSGSRLPIDYADVESPVLAVRLQEMFGLADTPRIARGRVALTLHLLSPAHRPVQVTRDLAGFWRTSYFDVRKDLRGRYPKHHWPDDPLAAPPTSRVKRRS